MRGAFEFDLDTNRDGTLTMPSSTSTWGCRAAAMGGDLGPGPDDRGDDHVFFTDHGTKSGNTVLSFCAEQIGMNAANFGQMMDVSLWRSTSTTPAWLPT